MHDAGRPYNRQYTYSAVLKGSGAGLSPPPSSLGTLASTMGPPGVELTSPLLSVNQIPHDIVLVSLLAAAPP